MSIFTSFSFKTGKQYVTIQAQWSMTTTRNSTLAITKLKWEENSEKMLETEGYNQPLHYLTQALRIRLPKVLRDRIYDYVLDPETCYAITQNEIMDWFTDADQMILSMHRTVAREFLEAYYSHGEYDYFDDQYVPRAVQLRCLDDYLESEDKFGLGVRSRDVALRAFHVVCCSWLPALEYPCTHSPGCSFRPLFANGQKFHEQFHLTIATVAYEGVKFDWEMILPEEWKCQQDFRISIVVVLQLEPYPNYDANLFLDPLLALCQKYHQNFDLTIVLQAKDAKQNDVIRIIEEYMPAMKPIADLFQPQGLVFKAVLALQLNCGETWLWNDIYAKWVAKESRGRWGREMWYRTLGACARTLDKEIGL
ncbi:hypothetical protein P280DRAFT_545254 [Massarina eburnea CBS 473.64]|uniref:Uncharacterized protein n=1 Tax=Massarina eburnea CBS 473.64 TaxID=1395130 RepID=A0A6A6SEH3_9PLEO|nr:hypothetical protein P280DRAFT_545254 [Massarina eburnea CBS 473.64]